MMVGTATTCKLCDKETQDVFGPLRHPVCLSCWLEIGDDFIIEYSSDLKMARDLLYEMRVQRQYEELIAEEILANTRGRK